MNANINKSSQVALRRTLASVALVVLSSTWLFVGNLACFESLPGLGEILLRREIVFNPVIAELVPSQTTTVGAQMTWGDDGVVESTWNVYPEAVPAIASATLSPQSGSHFTSVTLTASQPEEFESKGGVFTGGNVRGERLPVTAAYKDPLVKAAADFDFKPLPRVQKGYLPLKVINPRLKISARANATFRGDGLVELFSLVGEVEAVDTPSQWRYDFIFNVFVSGSTKSPKGYKDPYDGAFGATILQNTFQTLSNEDMTVVTSPNGKRSTFSAPNLEVGSDIEGFGIQKFEVQVQVRAVRVDGGTSKDLETLQLLTFGGNSKNYWSKRNSSKLVY